MIGAGIIGNLWVSMLHHNGYRDVTVSEPAQGRRDILANLGEYQFQFWKLGVTIHVKILVARNSKNIEVEIGVSMECHLVKLMKEYCQNPKELSLISLQILETLTYNPLGNYWY